MAGYKKYAENLIGNWEKDIYEPQKDVTKAIYQTNWNKLTDDYNTVKDKLERNFQLARNEYANTLNNVQNESFNRMNNANIDLANRGLSSSGLLNLISQGDTQVKGENVDKALSGLLATNNANLEGLREGVMGLGEAQTNLAGNLAGDIAKLTDADAANNQQYGSLISGLSEGAARRAASRASSGGGTTSKKTKQDKNLDEMYRTLGIIQTINSSDLSDDEKRTILMNDYDLGADTVTSAIQGYNNNQLLDTTLPKIEKLQGRLNDINNDWRTRQNAIDWNTSLDRLAARTNTGKVLDAINEVFNPYSAYDYWRRLGVNSNLQKQQQAIDGLTYSDLNEILFGNK